MGREPSAADSTRRWPSVAEGSPELPCYPVLQRCVGPSSAFGVQSSCRLLPPLLDDLGRVTGRAIGFLSGGCLGVSKWMNVALTADQHIYRL